ncbi:MAG: asparagine--tRNA ligase [Candidatus Cloacimonetes bacterium]|nr:asparagine--tRNA ligase [Candidatus Cloacimonadota bacterium]
MKHIAIKDCKAHIGEEIALRGWVRNTRSSGKLIFIILRDGTAEIQAIAFKPSLGEEKFAVIKSLTMESSVIVTGIPQEHPKKPDVFELDINEIEIVQVAEEYPITKKEHGVDFLLSNRHLWLRSRKQWAVLRIRHTVYTGIQEYLHKEGFIRFDSPIFTPSACEGTTTLFEVPYFDLGNAYLSQSGQLYLEAGIMSLGRVYDFGPVFRAEKSKTRKHLTEFWMMDAEAAFVEHEENMRIQESLIRYVICKALTENQIELEILERDTGKLAKMDAPFPIITYEEAIEQLQNKGSDIRYGDDFGAREEEMLTEGSAVPVFIEKWPKEIKAFYMKRDPEDDDLVLGSDLISTEGFGEIIGGSQREDDYDILLGRIKAQNLPVEENQWYLDLRKYGSVPHSGFGIGLERTVAWISGVQHIRETIPFPRMIYRIQP